jgi:osmotically-inducible protein OsmY
MELFTRALHISAPLLLCTALLSVAGCDNDAGSAQTVGQKLDRTLDTASEKIDATAARLGAGVGAAGEVVAATSGALTGKARDVGRIMDDSAITASIKADLLKDPHLSALRIDVNTVRGEVTLKGEAPSDISRQRALTLASAIAGVRHVRDEISVNP